MANKQGVALKISVLDEKGSFLDGTVDIRLEHSRLRSEQRALRDVDASAEIAISGLRRTPDGIYEVSVASSGPFKMQTKVVSIPSSGFATLDFIFEQTENEGSQLVLDVTEDLKRVDGAMTLLLSDRSNWQEFIRDPNGMLIRLGLHPPTSPEINDRVNGIFWTTLTDRKLLRLIGQHFNDFTPRRLREIHEDFLSGLAEGVVRHNIDYDLQAIEHFSSSDQVCTQALTRSLVQIKDAGLLENDYSMNEIHDYVNEVVRSIRAGEGIKEHPRLEVWDDFYGIGQPFGGVFFEAGPVVTALVGVEVAAAVTAIVDVGFWGLAVRDFSPLAAQGDENAIRAIAIAGRALDFAGDLLTHTFTLRENSAA